MNCQEFQDRLDLLLDERRPLDGDAELSVHAACCPACEDLKDAYALLDESFASTPPAKVRIAPAFLADLQPLAEDPLQPSSTPRRFRPLWLVPAAAAAMLAWIVLPANQQPANQPGPVAPPQAPALAENIPVSPALADSPRRTTVAVAAENVYTALPGPSRQMLANVSLLLAEPPAEESQNGPAMAWVRQAAGQLTTLAEPTVRRMEHVFRLPQEAPAALSADQEPRL